MIFRNVPWSDVIETSIRAAATSGLANLAIQGWQDGKINALSVDWLTCGGYTAGGAIAAFLLSISTLKVGERGQVNITGGK